MPTAGATSPVKGKRKTKVGRVVSDKMDKTIVVSVERMTRHRLYKRVIRASTKFAAHDEHNEAKIGDAVLIEESRPLSATKRWRLLSVLSRAGEERAGESIVADEAETTEAIHAAAHPGRHAADAQAEGAADADAGEPAREAAMFAKITGVEAAGYAADEAIQILGGYGFTVEYHVERHYRDAKMLEVLDGGTDALRDALMPV